MIEATDVPETVDGRYTECRCVAGVGASPVAASCLAKSKGACRLGAPVRECVIDIEMMSEVQMQSLSLAPHARVMCALPIWLCFRANRWELLPVAVTEHHC